jgi:signal transduction histidine kinase
MKHWLRGKVGGLAAFAIIAALVAGGLGWATAAALRLEREQLAQRAEAEHAAQLRVALWRLDSRLAALLARENSRPFNHYSAIYVPPRALDGPSYALVPSPLLDEELPAWMRLHFQVDSSGWESPQVLSPALEQRLRGKSPGVRRTNVTPDRKQALTELARDLPAPALLGHARRHAGETSLRDRTVLLAQRQVELDTLANVGNQVQEAQGSREFLYRDNHQAKLLNPAKDLRVARNFAEMNLKRNGEELLTQTRLEPGAEVAVRMSPIVGVWLPTRAGGEQLVALRLVRLAENEVCQGIALDGPALLDLLAEEVRDLFPAARVLPVREAVPQRLDRTMTALPLELDPGPVPPVTEEGWTPLRGGLALAWVAALVALLAVALGGWSLLDLSERRFRFVSAVTHELRTPLTTLRLYLDMLMNGLVRDEAQRAEYVRTLHAEADRLSRLVSNVLDFSRLEDRAPRRALAPVAVAGLLEQVRVTWQGRCQDAGKELVVEGEGVGEVCTDGELLQQVLGNLIDNACKYSREAEDRRVWVRARREGPRLAFEVEDRGPGVPPRERRSIFRAFRRGGTADVAAGGVGLGLALARRWARRLGGRLALRHAGGPSGACFRVELPAEPGPR